MKEHEVGFQTLIYWEVGGRAQRKVGKPFLRVWEDKAASVMAKRKDVGILNAQECKHKDEV